MEGGAEVLVLEGEFEEGAVVLRGLVRPRARLGSSFHIICFRGVGGVVSSFRVS